MEYVGKLADGTVFDQQQGKWRRYEGVFPDGAPFVLEEGQMIPGFLKGLQETQQGRRICSEHSG